MRTNLPVTQQEFQFPAYETLLSTTDTDGNMTFANAASIRTSGFSTEEIAGQPHNMVRHPDMPVEAFADMWCSLTEGQAWRALIKNRRQDGDHYWVCANTSPMRRNGYLVGYLSVRFQTARAEVEAAAAKEIKTLIDESVRNVGNGSRLMADAGRTMGEVLGQVRPVNDLVTEISVASKEQARGISQVGQAVAHLDQMTQQNATMVEQSSAAAISMGERAQRLVAGVKVYSA